MVVGMAGRLRVALSKSQKGGCEMRDNGENNNMSRRNFMRNAASMVAAAGALSGSPCVAFAATPGANERLGVGVIGVGGRGNAHLGALNWIKDNDKNIDIVAVSDVYRPRLEAAAKNFGAKPYMDHHELLADPNVDIVTIATPDHHHAYQAIDAVRAGKDVYCEKPVSHWRQFEVTKQLVEEVKKSGRVFQLGTQGMSDSAWGQMRRLIQDGMIGQPIHAECGYFRVGDWGERGMPIDDPNVKPGSDLNWEAFLGDSPKRDFDVSRFFRWRMYEDYAGGPSTDLFPHSLTPTVYMLGLKTPDRVVSAGGKWRYNEREIPDTFNMLIDYPDKITVAVLGTQGNDDQGTGHRGSPGRIPVVRGWEGSLTVKDDQILFRPAEGSGKKELHMPIEHGEDLVRYFQHFINCCKNGAPSDSLSPVELAFNVQTSLQMGALSLHEDKIARFDQSNRKIIL
jgi:predicted dehydrogenase